MRDKIVEVIQDFNDNAHENMHEWHLADAILKTFRESLPEEKHFYLEKDSFGTRRNWQTSGYNQYRKELLEKLK